MRVFGKRVFEARERGSAGVRRFGGVVIVAGAGGVVVVVVVVVVVEGVAWEIVGGRRRVAD